MPLDQAANIFLDKGILGAIVVVLAVVIVLQDRRNRSDVEKLDTALGIQYEKRVADSAIYVEKFIKTSETLLNQNKEAMTLIQSNQKALETIASILQNIKRLR